jgi:hypothetical protein
VVLDGVTINRAALETATDGVITTQAGSSNTLVGVTVVAGTTVDVVDGSTVTLEGTTTDQGSIAVGSVAGATLAIAPVGLLTGVTLTGGGSVVMSDSAANLITDTGVAATLTNAGDVISGAGMIGNSGDGLLTLVNKGTIDATGIVNALTIDTGNAVSNTGTLEATGGGKLIVDDNVSGTGKGLIASASEIELAGTLNTAAVTFQDNAGDTGIFVLDHAANPDASHGCHGTIAGFLYDGTNSDTLDLKDIQFVGGETWSFTQTGLTKGVLTVNDNVGDIATLNLLGNYLAVGKSANSGSSTLFALALDSGTGTSVTTSHHV